MKKNLIKLSLISIASVLAFSGCSNLATSKTAQPAVVQFDGDHKELPHYRDSELPDEEEVYDLTEELTYDDIVPATAEEFEQFLISVGGQQLYNLAKKTAPKLLSYIEKYNVLTKRELYDISDIVGKIIGATQGKEFDPATLVVDVATKINLDKIYYLVHNVRADKDAYAEVKQFIINVSNSTFIPLNYQAAHEYLKKTSAQDKLAAEAISESLAWNNFKVNGDSLEPVEVISEFFNNEDLRVFLRFVNLLARSLAKNLTRHELGFVFSQAGLIEDEEYANLCYRYMMNNASSFVKHLGNIIKGINITDNSWMMALRGLQFFAAATSGDDDFMDDDHFVAIDNLREKAWLEQLDFVYNSIDPSGIKVLLKFFGNVLSNLPKDMVNSIMINMETPDQIDVEAYTEFYSEQYGLLSASEKEILNTQLDLFDIDLDNFNVIIDDFDPEESSPLDYLMEVLNENLIGPFMDYFMTGIEVEPVYPEYEYLSEPRLYADDDYKLIVRQDDAFTDEDLTSFIKKNRPFYFEVYAEDHYVGSNWHKDTDFERKNMTFDGHIDTSSVGEKTILINYDVTFEFEMQDEQAEEGHSTVTYDYEFEVKLIYYVLDKRVSVYDSGFRTDLYSFQTGSYIRDSEAFKDSNGNIACLDFKGVVNLEQNADYAEGELKIKPRSYSIHKYIEAEKRYVEISSKESYFDVSEEFVDIASFDVSTLGLHYGFIEVTYKRNGQVYCKAKMVYAYNVVESIDYDVEDGFYDPGFGW